MAHAGDQPHLVVHTKRREQIVHTHVQPGFDPSIEQPRARIFVLDLHEIAAERQAVGAPIGVELEHDAKAEFIENIVERNREID